LAPTVKSGIGIELNVQGVAPSDSVPCSDTIRETAKLSTNNSNRTLLLLGERLTDFPNIPSKLRQRHDGKTVRRPFFLRNVGFAKKSAIRTDRGFGSDDAMIDVDTSRSLLRRRLILGRGLPDVGRSRHFSCLSVLNNQEPFSVQGSLEL